MAVKNLLTITSGMRSRDALEGSHDGSRLRPRERGRLEDELFLVLALRLPCLLLAGEGVPLGEPHALVQLALEAKRPLGQGRAPEVPLGPVGKPLEVHSVRRARAAPA
eukprot:scaffold886_cov249-Pinguiococcus_pyrenoidosus.AAC.7